MTSDLSRSGSYLVAEDAVEPVEFTAMMWRGYLRYGVTELMLGCGNRERKWKHHRARVRSVVLHVRLT